MKNTGILIIATLLLAGSTLTQGSWEFPVSIKDYFIMINAIRTEPTRFVPRVKALFEDQRNAAGLHNNFGVTYTDTQITDLKNYLQGAAAVSPVELNRGLTIVAWKHARHMASINNLGTGIGPTGLNLQQRVTAMGTQTGALEEVRALTLQKGHTAEISILHRMMVSATDRAVIRNPLHKFVGIGLEKNINQYYASLIFSQDFTCTMCHTITDKEEEDSYWNQYLRDWYNPDDTDGNLRIGKMSKIASVVVGMIIGFIGLQF